MLLYYTDKMRGLQLADPKNGVGDWVEFTDHPRAGYGDATYIIDVPEGVVKQWEFTGGEPNLIKNVRYFDIPARELSKFQIRTDSYRRLTGTPWNEWTILLRPSIPDFAGTQTIVWASRDGAVTLEAFEKNKDRFVRVTLAEDFDPTEDYLILETRQFNGRQWNLEVLVGVTPEWVDFPAQWAEWVSNKDVQISAVQFLKEQFPALVPLVDAADQEEDKVTKIHAWKLVAAKLERLIGGNFSRITAGSWTSTLAMPIRLAERVGGWNPPASRPVYSSPDSSGRICVARSTPERGERGEPEVTGTGYIVRKFASQRDTELAV